MLLPLLMACGISLQTGCSDDSSVNPLQPHRPVEPPRPGDLDDTTDPDRVVVTYTEDLEAFPNPERGFYTSSIFYLKNGKIPSPLNPVTLKANRTQHRTLILAEYFLTDFIDKPLSEAALELVRKNMQIMRENGTKCIMRFAYTDSQDVKPHDATEEVALEHIAQLSPILHEYGDVILVFQAGFIGTWGEWYYTDNFVFNPQTEEDYLPRRRLIEALLKAVPTNRTIAIRTPKATMMSMGLDAKNLITEATAYDGSDRSRLGGHNDCFLHDGNDTGTFSSKADREFWKNDSRYTCMGGETCGTSSYCACDNSLETMAQYHWTYLHINYHPQVIQGWKEQECFDEIERRLGYRFVLTRGDFPREIKAGEKFSSKITLKNDGFAAPVNPRGLELVFVSQSNPSEQFSVKLDEDPRFWFGGDFVTITTDFTTPQLRSGKEYNLYLNLPDDAEQLRENPLFSIRTANKDTWDEQKGMNLLHHFIAR